MSVGNCILHRTNGNRLVVEQADPVIDIAAELWDQIKAGDRHVSADGRVTIAGDVLTIRADNRTVVYRIGAYDAESHTYRAEWPD